jgi:hypothetical protein
MCFSATASFSAAAVCGAVGIATVRRAGKADLMLAVIPLVFSLHQALEGVVWLTKAAGCGRDAGYGFAVVAFCLWPVYVPVASWYSESDTRLRAFMLAFAIPGAVVSAAAAWVLFRGLDINFTPNQIQYLPTTHYPLIFDYIYAACVIGPIFLSRSIYLRAFGSLVLLFFIFSTALFNPARYSVWCFFAAASSIVLYFFITSRSGAAGGRPARKIEPRKI